MTRFYMTIGIAGCGKSSWENKKLEEGIIDKVYSSDAYRQKLLGDINDQNHNDIVFKELYSDVIKALKENKNDCLDATNFTIKTRSKILNLIQENKINCEKIAVFFEVEFSIILRQNATRERKVPEHVLHDMHRKIQIPFLEEGFDKIETVFRCESNIQLYDIQKSMYGFDQNNPHHSNDLWEHCSLAYSNLLGKTDNAELLLASTIHDFGKIYTKTFDEEKEYSHFIGHENYGAYMSLFIDWYPFMVDKEKIAFYICYHMIPYHLEHAREDTIEKYKKLFGNKWNDIMLLHEADANAH